MGRLSFDAPRRGEEAARIARRDRNSRLECEVLEERVLLFNPAGDEVPTAWELLDVCCDAVEHEVAADGHFEDDDHLDHALPPVDESLAPLLGDAWGATEEATTATGTFTFDAALAPLSETFQLSSNDDASHTIFLDFDGHVTTGTHWNTSYHGGADIVTAAYDFDGNVSVFSDAELQRIQYIWQRVAEDFMPFDVNVTTADPGYDALTKSGGGDSTWGVRIVIGGSSGDWYGGSAGGVARVGSFNYSTDTPAFVFEAQLGNGHEKYTAEAITHEAGHTLGLSHDGASGTSYYQGHGSGETGWAPIMGVGYYKNLTQWSRGEYSGATNTQDDLAIITGGNGFGYRVDDHGGTAGAATSLNSTGTSVSGGGIIERNTDVDVFSFNTAGGAVDLSIDAFERGANLDVLAELYDAAGSLVFSSNPLNLLSATISTAIPAGQYFLHVSGAGQGSPSTGYSDYGSLGQYSISGTIAPSSDEFLAISATDAVKAEGDAGSTAFTFTVTRSGDLSGATTVDYAVFGAGVDGADFVGGALPGGALSFAAGETAKSITVNVAGDTTVEGDESFTVQLANASGAAQIATATASGLILNDDAPPAPEVQLAISATDAAKAEGNDGTTPFTFTVTRGGDVGGSTTVEYSIVGSGANAAGAADFSGGQALAGSLTFAAGETSQTITVNVAGDELVEADETFVVQLTSATGGADIIDGQATGTIVNDDVAAPAGVTVTPTSGLTTKEDGASTSFDVVLNARPTDTVVIDVASLDASEGTVSVNQLVFTVDNWNVAQSVVVTGVDDGFRDGNQTYTIQLTSSAANPGAYAVIDVDDVVVTNQDNEKGRRGGDGGGSGGGGNGGGNGKPKKTNRSLASHSSNWDWSSAADSSHDSEGVFDVGRPPWSFAPGRSVAESFAGDGSNRQTFAWEALRDSLPSRGRRR